MGEETRAAMRAIEMVERKDRVLIVEDEDNARKGYEQLLQRWGCDVVGVGTAEEALAKFASYQPDTLIADVELPGMNGLDLLKQLGPELYDVPAIIITGKGSEERAVAAIEAGAFWYIEKPLKGPVLRALLDRALRGAAAATARDGTPGRPRGGVKGDAGGDAHRGDGRAELGVGIDHRRDGVGQRNRGADAAQAFAARQRTVCGDQLFSHPRNIDGERDFWPRARGLHGRG